MRIILLKVVFSVIVFISACNCNVLSQENAAKTDKLKSVKSDSLKISSLLEMNRESLLELAVTEAHLQFGKKGVKTTLLPKEQMKIFKSKNAIYVLISKGFYFSPESNAIENYEVRIHFTDGKAAIFPEDYDPSLPKYKLNKAQQKLVTIADIGEIPFREDKTISIKDKDALAIEYTESAATKHGGGTICYSVNKTTKEKKMLWHEHPFPVGMHPKAVNTDTANISDDNEFVEFVN